MKKIFQKICAFSLALSLLFTSVPVQAFNGVNSNLEQNHISGFFSKLSGSVANLFSNHGEQNNEIQMGSVTESEIIGLFEDATTNNSLEIETDKNVHQIPSFLVDRIFNSLNLSPLDQEIRRIVYFRALQIEADLEKLETQCSEVVNILSQANLKYSKLSNDEKQKLCAFFGISDAFFDYSRKKGESVQKAIEVYKTMTDYGLSEEQISSSINDGTRDQKIDDAKREWENTYAKDNRTKVPNKSVSSRAMTLSTDDPFQAVKLDKAKTLSEGIQVADGVTENVDLSSGNLEYTATDVELPGAGGLDLVIKRQYNSKNANYYSVGGDVKYRYNNNNSTNYAYMNISHKIYKYEKKQDNTIGNRVETSNPISHGSFPVGTSALNGIYGQQSIPEENGYLAAYIYSKRLTEIGATNEAMFAQQASDPITYNDKVWELGTGWKLNFSSIEKYSYFELGYMKLHLGDGREFNVSKNWVNNLGYYTYEDVIFKEETNTIGGQTSTYTVSYADGKKEYFNSEGRIIAIVDRFGNMIKFEYLTVNHRLEIRITDSLGRIITVKNEPTDTGYRKIITLPDGKTVTYVLNENVSRENLKSLETYPGQYNEYNLVGIMDQNGEATSYSYADLKCPSDISAYFHKVQVNGVYYLNASDSYVKGNYYYSNYYAQLTEITYPTGLKTNYTYYQRYNNWFDFGCKTDIAIKSRCDRQDSKVYNQKQYEYSYEFKDKTGALQGFLYNADYYDNSLWNSSNPFQNFNVQYTVKEIDSTRNVKTQYTFNRFGLCTQQETYFNASLVEKTTSTYEYFNLFYHPRKSNVSTTKYDTSNSSPITVINCYKYDNKGNTIAYWPPLSEGNTSDESYKVSMSYHPLYNYLLSKTFKKDSNTTVAAQNVPSADQKSIAQSLVFENSGLKEKTEYQYDTYGNITQIKEYESLAPESFTQTVNTYDNGTYLINVKVDDVKDADGNNLGSVERQVTRDIYGRITSETDSNGKTTAYTYDHGRLTLVSYPDGSTEAFQYNLVLNQKIATDPLGYQTLYQYDKAGNLLDVYSLKDDGTKQVLQSYTYDGAYRLTQEKNNVDAGGRITVHTYNHRDQETEKKTTSATGGVLADETYNYYADKSAKTIVGDSNSPSIVTTSYQDKMGRILKIGRMLDGTEYEDTYSYDYAGNRTSEKSAYTNSIGKTYTNQYAYDYSGRVLSVTDALGKTSYKSYDAVGNLVSETDKKGNTTSYSYDALGRLIKKQQPMTEENGRTYHAITKYRYDSNGNLICEETANSEPGEPLTYAKTEYNYDQLNQLVKVIAHDGDVANYTQYFYDKKGNLLRMYTGLTAPLTIAGLDNVSGSDMDYSVTRYEYDRYSNLISMTDPLNQTETYTYDINGNQLTKTDRNGAVTTHAYDGLGRVTNTAVVTPDGNGNIAVSISYTKTGQKQSESNGVATSTYRYDALGRVTQENVGETTKTYGYNIGDARTSFVLSINGVPQLNQSYTYDALNRMQTMKDGSTTKVTYTYDPNGNRASLVYDNGLQEEYQYNKANLLACLTNKKDSTVLSQYSYTYYLDGNQARKTEPDGKVVNYTYDGLSRLKNEAETHSGQPYQSYLYTFDDHGNRASLTAGGTEQYTVTYRYDLNNRLLEENKTQGTTQTLKEYYYDKNGNRKSVNVSTLQDSGTGAESISLGKTAAEVSLFDYNGFNQLTKVSRDSNVSEYTYLPSGLRDSKTVNGVTTKFDLDGGSVVLESQNGAIVGKYLRAQNLVSGTVDGAQKYYLYNGHGDVVNLTDAAGTVTKSYDYDAFGNEKYSNENDANVFRYCGEYYDKETGEYYLRARYYNPVNGRFDSEDSVRSKKIKLVSGKEIDDPLSLNLYTYCENDPIQNIDPSGHVPLETIADVASLGWSVHDMITKPSLANAGYLLWDIAGTALPYVPGSWTAKGAKAGGKALSRSHDATNLVKKAGSSIAKSAGKSTRDVLLESVSNQKLKNAISEMYRSGAKIGDGGLADAIRHEIKTGELVGGKSHIMKGQERTKNLENILKNQTLNSTDRAIAQNLLKDLKSALGGTKK